MCLFQNVRIGNRFRLGLLGVLIVSTALGVLDGASALGAGAQPPPGQGDVYVTKSRPAPDGTIFKILDIGLGLNQIVARDLGMPSDIACSPDGRFLFVNDLFRRDKNFTVHRILRFNRDGTVRREMAKWETTDLRPSSMVLTPNGDLYFGTFATALGLPTRGLWRIRDALGSQVQLPEQVLSGGVFTPTPPNAGAFVRPFAILTAGPYAGDLLIIESAGMRILRASAPNYTSFQVFVPQVQDPATGASWLPLNGAMDSQGDLLITTSPGLILRYGPDGAPKGVFASVQPPPANRIAIGPDDFVYATNTRFQAQNANSQEGRLLIYDPQGTQVTSTNFLLGLLGVTVC